MKENFFKVGYTDYLQKNKRTSSFFNKIMKHKLMLSLGLIIIFCTLMNFWLIYKFISILS